MTNIAKLFDADSIDLHDLRADPNTIVKIQRLVKEMLEANENRQKGIFIEVLDDFGAFALPGVISATYVLGKHLASRQSRALVADLLAALCEGSSAACHLLLDAGLIHNPFDRSREVVVQALAKIGGFEITSEEQKLLLQAAKRLARDNERSASLSVLEFSLARDFGYGAGLDVCASWFRSEYVVTEAALLANLLLQKHRDKTEEILDAVLRSVGKRDDEAAQAIKSQLDLADPSVLPAAIRAASRRLDIERNPRAKPVEYLFEGAVARQIKRAPECIKDVEPFIWVGGLNDGIGRYWWQALSSAVTLGCLEARMRFSDLAQTDEDDNAIWGVVQLLFLKTRQGGGKSTAWVTELLSELEVSRPALVERAKEMKEALVPAQRPEGIKRRKTGNTMID